ncbi:MAG: hypothetical protein IJ576_05430 [Synergistaceae bacterium]|nr:hypothetical protein [Synergistaceae bacterium]
MASITVELTPELERRINEWSSEFKEPPQVLAVGLLEEYFEDCDTGAEIAAKIDAGSMKVYKELA